MKLNKESQESVIATIKIDHKRQSDNTEIQQHDNAEICNNYDAIQQYTLNLTKIKQRNVYIQ